MINVASYHQNAEDCVHQAGLEETPEDKNILLNVALAWLRLAQQTQALAHAEDLAEDPAEDAPIAPTHDEVVA